MEAVSNYIAAAHSATPKLDLSDHSDEEVKALISLLERVITDFCNYCSNQDHHVKNICKTYRRENLFEFIAKMWIVARYDYEGEIATLNERRKQFQEKGEVVVTLLDDDHPILRNSNRLVEYSSLLSLLIHTQRDEYVGGSFILDTDPSQFVVNKPSERLPIELMMVPWFCAADDDRLDTEDLRWKFFPR